ncbi:GNAT family N-acetyltransferase [Oricola sp.]|uniref:GNAT family N-acetyltransferase n=1 Tax=Oricola sp. TaxID=1979950 RepID=UPI003BAD4758
MNATFKIRDSQAGDIEALDRLYPDAFPEEDLVPLVHALLAGDQPVLSLVATSGGEVVGHVVFTRCAVPECGGRAALLGPLAVAPARQKAGIGSALIRAGHEKLAAEDVTQVLVLGDPAYYSRHGFAPERAVAPPYPLPDEWDGAWQSLALGGGPALEGTLDVPASWRHPEYWGA